MSTSPVCGAAQIGLGNATPSVTNSSSLSEREHKIVFTRQPPFYRVDLVFLWGDFYCDARFAHQSQ